MLRTLRQTAIVLVAVLLLAEIPGDAAFLLEAQAERESETVVEDVDCLFPGQIRPLGSTTYVTRGRTIKTTRKDCEAQGGMLVDPKERGGGKPNDEPAKHGIQSPK